MSVPFVLQSPIGMLSLFCNGSAITKISLSETEHFPGYTEQVPDCIKDAAAQLTDYFFGRLQTFRFPMAPGGTPFQQQVWNALCKIPYGQTRSYGEIARSIGKPGAARAVGMANHCNPILIAIPCHRVIGTDGSLTGYGAGLKNKEFLLTLEGSFPR